MDTKGIKIIEELFINSEYKTIGEVKLRYLEVNKALQETIARKSIPNHLLGLSKGAALLKVLSPSDIVSIVNLGIHRSFVTSDMTLLNNALYTYNRLAYNRALLFSSGTDHSKYLGNVIESFAGNDINLVMKIFNAKVGLTSNGHKFNIIASNLLLSMIYKENDWMDKSISNAEKYLTQKITNFDKAVTNYLICLSVNNGGEASRHLDNACYWYRKAKSLHDFKSPFLSIFGLFLHGLYNLAYYTLPKLSFEKIEEPPYSVFWKLFSEFNRENNFQRGVEFLIFEKELDVLNFIYE